MQISSPARQVCWGALASVALIGTWAQILDYLKMPFLQAQVQFWRDTALQPVGRFATIDLVLLVLAVSVWMLAEARRLRIRFVWLYITYGCGIAFSSALPLFMLMRERALARRGETESSLATGDQIGLLPLVLFSLGYLWFATRAAFPG